MANPFAPSNDAGHTTLERLSQGADFRVNTTIPALTHTIGGTVELEGITTFVISDRLGKPWARVTMAPVAFAVNAPADVSVEFNFSAFETPSPAVLAEVFPNRAFDLHVTTHWRLRFWGSTWYEALPLYGTYTLPIPHTLQDQFDAVVRNPLQTSPSNAGTNATVELLSASGGTFRINATVPALSLLPGVIVVGSPTTTVVISDALGKRWAKVVFNSVALPMDATSRVSVEGAFSMFSLPTASVVQEAVATNNFAMLVDSNWSISAWGRVWFDKLPLHSQFDVNSTTGAQLWGLVKCKLYVC
ncbi:hypothetical protein ACHHYP_15659 [Achlya hypogyna]|uniref:Uncharacterized protein n=1 Tax=Achlya hypogyna TaxID=1202772 RepID=A0A1V9YAH3_ACHHY|nr:hypothetical protein ACHHYP_15659 [Achlya hypogyna]